MGDSVEAAFPECIEQQAEPLVLLGHGSTDVTIETIHVKFTEIGVYFGQGIRDCLKAWKAQPVSEILKEGSGFYKQLIEAPVKKLIKVVLVKSQKGRQYGSSLETRVRDKLASEDKFEDEEDEELEKLVEFFQNKKLEPGASVAYVWPPSNATVEVSVYPAAPSTPQVHAVGNPNVSAAVLDWFLGEQCLSISTLEAIAQNVA